MGLSLGKNKFRFSRETFNYLKGVVLLLCLFLLIFGGIRGRKDVLRRGMLDEITLLRQQLQQVLDEEPRPTERLIAGIPANSSPATQSSASSEQSGALLTALILQIEKFQSDHPPGACSAAENLQLRLGLATVANAEKRFADALASISSQAETEAQVSQRASVLQARGDSFYGLQERQKALDCYQRMLQLQPQSILALARVADCQYALGKTQEAQATFGELAQSHRRRGDSLLILGRLDAAGASYQKSVAIDEWLVDKLQDKRWVAQFASSLSGVGNALLLEGKAGSAVAPYEKAVALLAPLANGDGQGNAALARSQFALGNALLAQGKASLASARYEAAIAGQAQVLPKDESSDGATARAASWVNLGNCLLSQQKLEAAATQFDRVVELHDRLSKSNNATELALVLALAYNNRGVIRRIQGHPDAALADFGEAGKIVSQSPDQPQDGEFAVSSAGGSASDAPQVTLDVAIGLSEKTIEIVPRTRLVEQGRRKSSAVVLAMSLKNLGYTRLAQGNPQEALGTLQKAAEVYATLVDINDQKDLAAPFARTLGSIAWVYATHPDPSVRNGEKAMQYASKACELTDWKSVHPLEALAAACAESGHFDQAIKWQQVALDGAPVDRKSDVRARLELYRSGKPYRT